MSHSPCVLALTCNIQSSNLPTWRALLQDDLRKDVDLRYVVSQMRTHSHVLWRGQRIRVSGLAPGALFSHLPPHKCAGQQVALGLLREARRHIHHCIWPASGQ